MTGYMSEMRKLVGHRTIIQCAASVICVDVNGKILLGKRTDNHKWAYAGGSVEIDEYAEDCLQRYMDVLFLGFQIFHIRCFLRCKRECGGLKPLPGAMPEP